MSEAESSSLSAKEATNCDSVQVRHHTRCSERTRDISCCRVPSTTHYQQSPPYRFRWTCSPTTSDYLTRPTETAYGWNDLDKYIRNISTTPMRTIPHASPTPPIMFRTPMYSSHLYMRNISRIPHRLRSRRPIVLRTTR